METTLDPYADDVKTSGKRIMSDAGEAAENVTALATDEIKSLIADVEDLVSRLADFNDADVTRVRNKVLDAVGTAKDKLASSADTVKRQAQKSFGIADDYVHDSPWAAVGLAALVGAVAGILVARRS